MVKLITFLPKKSSAEELQKYYSYFKVMTSIRFYLIPVAGHGVSANEKKFLIG
jgi:hypothetical protein